MSDFERMLRGELSSREYADRLQVRIRIRNLATRRGRDLVAVVESKIWRVRRG